MKNGFLFLILTLLISQYLYSQNCISIDQSDLSNEINNFRVSNGKAKLILSFALCEIAVQKAESLQNSGYEVSLASGLFNSDQKMINLKVRAIDANSKNTFPTLSMKHPSIEFWKVILEEDSYSGKNWKSFGVGLYKNYAVLWFSDKSLDDVAQVCGNQVLNTQTEIIIGTKKELPIIKNGKWLVEPTYFEMGFGYTENDFFPVADNSAKWGFINLKGEVVIPFQFQNAYGFSEGLASVKVNEKYGYINPGGEFEIAPDFDYARYFYKGSAIVGQNNLEYLINTRGEKITQGSSDMAMLNDDYVVYKQGALYGIKDISGKILKAPFMSDFFGYSEGLAGVKIQGKWGFMDENFNLVIAPKYTEKLVYAFHNGYARFMQNGKVGMIDKTGKVTIEPVYEELYELSEGLIAFSQNRKWGYMRLDGEIVIAPQYLRADNFKYGMAIVQDSDLKKHLIDQNNERIIGDVYGLFVFKNNLIGVEAKHGWGLVQLDR